MDEELEIIEKPTTSVECALEDYLSKALTTIARAQDLLKLAEKAYEESRDAKDRKEKDEARAEGTEYLKQAEKVFLGE